MKRVLVVEADFIVALALKKYIEAMGLEVKAIWSNHFKGRLSMNSLAGLFQMSKKVSSKNSKTRPAWIANP